MIIVPIIPYAKPRMTQSDKWRTRPSVLKYRAFCDELRLRLAPYRYKPPPCLVIEFYLPPPASMSQKKKEALEGKPYVRKPDIDNLIKSVLDALCEDDSYVYSVTASKYYSNNPRIVFLT